MTAVVNGHSQDDLYNPSAHRISSMTKSPVCLAARCPGGDGTLDGS